MGTEQKEEMGVGFNTHKLNLELILLTKTGWYSFARLCNLPTTDKKNQSAAPQNSKLKMISHYTQET